MLNQIGVNARKLVLNYYVLLKVVRIPFTRSNYIGLRLPFQSSPHLSQLLMRLDFNGFYSGRGGTLGTS